MTDFGFDTMAPWLMRTTPVDHDPFAPTAVPVDHDPFLPPADTTPYGIARAIEHQQRWGEKRTVPEQIGDIAAETGRVFNPYGGGLSAALKRAGVKLPDWSNAADDVLQSDAANTAIGVTGPIMSRRMFLGGVGATAASRALPAAATESATAAVPKAYVPPWERPNYGDILRPPEPAAYSRLRASLAASPVNIERAADDLERALQGGKAATERAAEEMGSAPSVAAEPKPSITAYHGSPHDFDRFDISKIGTGEGAQAYGHGLYFAENEGVARNYRDALAASQDMTRPELHAFNQLAIDNGDSALAAKKLRYHAQKELLDDPQRQAEFLDAAKLLDAGYERPKGRMYQVSIKAHPDEFLDWDKPLSEQSERVQAAVRNELNPRVVTGDEASNLRPDMQGRLNYPHYVVDNLGRLAGYTDEATARRAADLSGSNIVSSYGDGPEVSQKLRQAGVPGIKYLDQGSRVTPNTAAEKLATNTWVGDAQKTIDNIRVNERGRTAQDAIKLIESGWRPGQEVPGATRNYVVFDDKLVDIMKKYGIAGLMAAGAYHFKTSPVNHDPFEAQ